VRAPYAIAPPRIHDGGGTCTPFAAREREYAGWPESRGERGLKKPAKSGCGRAARPAPSLRLLEVWRIDGVVWRPRRVFYRRALRFRHEADQLAWKLNDQEALHHSTSEHHVLILLALARGRRRVVELGTGAGWTSACLAVDDSKRVVRTFDPHEREHRNEYLNLAGMARDRIVLNDRPGREPDGLPADFIFIDSSHKRDETIREIEAWRPFLLPGAVVAFHDYNPEWPGVSEAISELGLKGQDIAGIYVWKP